jgi:hypothetical protein
MKHLKAYRLFENHDIDIDIEEIELLFVNLTDDDFQVRVSKIYNGFKVEIDKQTNFSTSDIVDEVLFAIDLIKKKYDLVPTKIYYKTNNFSGHKVLSIEEVFSKNDVIKCLEISFTKEKIEEPKKGIVGKFLDRFKSKELPIEEKIIDDDLTECIKYIRDLSSGYYNFFVSNREVYNRMLLYYNPTIIKEIKLVPTQGGFIATIKVNR